MYGGLLGHTEFGLIREGTAQANCVTAQVKISIEARMFLDSSQIERVKTSRPASAYYMTMDRLPHHRKRRKGLLTENSISRKVSKALQHLANMKSISLTFNLQLRKQIEPSPLFSDPNYLTPPFRNRHHLIYHLTLLPPTQRPFTTHQDQERRQQISRPPHFPPVSHLRHLTRISSRTCPLGIIQIFPGTQHHQGHHRVGTGRISTHVRIFTAYPRSASIAKGFFSAREKHPEQSARSHSKYSMRQISRTIFI